MGAVLTRLIQKTAGRFSALGMVLLAGLAAVVTFGAASLGKTLLSSGPEAWPLWPGCAALVAILLLLPRKAWRALIPAGIAGFALADLLIGFPSRMIVILLAGEAAAILVAVFGVRAFLGHPRLDSLRALAVYCFFTVFLAASIVAVFVAIIVPGAYALRWGVAFLAEALAFLTLTPAVLGWARQLRARRSRGWYAEMGSMLLAAVVLSYFIFAGGPRHRRRCCCIRWRRFSSGQRCASGRLEVPAHAASSRRSRSGERSTITALLGGRRALCTTWVRSRCFCCRSRRPFWCSRFWSSSITKRQAPCEPPRRENAHARRNSKPFWIRRRWPYLSPRTGRARK